MTLIVNIPTYEGSVVAADSKQVQTQNGMLMRASTNITKIFEINNKTIASLAGLAFFERTPGRYDNVADYINEYAQTTDDTTTVKEIAQGLYQYILDRYPIEKQMEIAEETLKTQAAMAGDEIISITRFCQSLKFKAQDNEGNIKEGYYNLEPVNIMVSGYNENNETEVYEMRIPGSIELKRGPNDYGCTWIGQGDVVARLVLGYDGRMLNTPIFQEILQTHSQEELIGQIRNVEYNVSWNLLPLQDAIDMAVFLIKTTETMQKFSCGIIGENTEIPAVGGPIDVAVITKNDGIKWINRKEPYLPDE